MEEKLLTGTAYHGNRILRHVEEDMRDIAAHGMNLVVHMFTHNDWVRHLGVMRDIVDASHENGLEVWIDNWGLGGPPGDQSCFLQYHPEAHQVYSDGSVDPLSACYNSEAFVQFTKDWLETVRGFGGDHIFWDEPRYKVKKEAWDLLSGEAPPAFTCQCATCKKLFAERYGKPMPTVLTPELEAFRRWSMANYFDRVTSYAASMGMQNTVCVMLRFLDVARDIVALPNVNDFGIDPYWHPENPKRYTEPYSHVYTNTKNILRMAQEYQKKTHVWVQGYDIPSGYEDEIILATDAAYDAGARTILTWSFRGGEPNSYRCDHCEQIWSVMGEAMHRIRARHFDKLRAERLKALEG